MTELLLFFVNINPFFMQLFLNLYHFIMLQIGELVEDIFEAGFWVAIILVVLVILILIWIFRKLRGRGRR